MRAPIAFLQLGRDTFACAQGALDAVTMPGAACASWLAPRFSLDDRHPWWWQARGAPTLALLDRREWAERFPRRDAVDGLAWGAPDEGRFHAGFGTLQAHLAAGVLRKGVPITVARAPLAPRAAWPLFRQLLARVADLPGQVVAYGLFLPGEDDREGPEFVIGASPELLFEVEPDGVVKTMAVAGTRRVAPGSAAALEGSAKERGEHEAVVEDLLAQASRWGSAERGPTEVRRFGDLQHLVTGIAVSPAAPPDFTELVRALHPTPALGVYPRGAAGTAWLASIDPDEARRRFGAPFGIRWPSGAGRVAVAIRNLQYHDGHVEIWAGCGVVPESRYDAEWQELLDKIQAVRTMWNV